MRRTGRGVKPTKESRRLCHPGDAKGVATAACVSPAACRRLSEHNEHPPVLWGVDRLQSAGHREGDRCSWALPCGSDGRSEERPATAEEGRPPNVAAIVALVTSAAWWSGSRSG